MPEHTIDTDDSGLIGCPNDPSASWTFELHSDDEPLPPFCMACGARVPEWVRRADGWPDARLKTRTTVVDGGALDE